MSGANLSKPELFSQNKPSQDGKLDVSIDRIKHKVINSDFGGVLGLSGEDVENAGTYAVPLNSECSKMPSTPPSAEITSIR